MALPSRASSACKYPSNLVLVCCSSTHLFRVVHYDGNVYEDALVQEWLNEVRNAVHWYLGDGTKVQDAGIQAKL